MIKLNLIYTDYVPYNNRERFKSKIAEFFPKDVPYDLEEYLAGSEDANITLRLVGASVTPNMVAFETGTDFYAVMDKSSWGGYTFPDDELIKRFFKIIEDGHKRIEAGDDIDDIVDDQENERQKIIERNKLSNKLAETVGIDPKAAKNGLKIFGGAIVAGTIGFCYFYYKMHKTEVNINLQN